MLSSIWLTYQNYYFQASLMLPPTQDVRLISVKISNFSPFLQSQAKMGGRYSEDYRVTQHRNMVHSSLSAKRASFYSQDQRFSKTANQSRLSRYLKQQSSLINNEEQLRPIIFDKIKQLKQLICDRENAIKTSRAKQSEGYAFSEFKIMKTTQVSPSTLHSRKRFNSSFTKMIKSRRNVKEERVAAAEPKLDHKKRKIILIGGGISSNSTNQKGNNINSSRSKEPKVQRGKIHSSYYLRRELRNRATPTPELVGESEEDCKPWQIHKQEHLDQYGHVNYL